MPAQARTRAVRRRPRRRLRAASRRVVRARALVAAAALGTLGILLGLAFAGSPSKIAAGVRIAGVNVGGLTPREARNLLEKRARALQSTPVVFTAGSHRWSVKPIHLGVRVDWRAAVEDARRQGDGFGPVRGFRRIGVRVFGADVTPTTRVWDAALRYEIKRFARAVDRPHREAAIRLRGLRPVVVPGRAGRVLDRQAATAVVVRALAGVARHPVALPVKVDQPRVTAADLVPVATRVKTAVSAPVRLTLGPTTWRLPRWRIAQILSLPAHGERGLRIGGPRADKFFARFEKAVNREPRDADFAVSSGRVHVVPSKDGLALDVRRAAQAILAAALSTTNRTGRMTVSAVEADRTTAEAQTMGIRGLVGGYHTYYGGDPNRIHNVQLVARLIDRHLIAPGATFSFNGTTGARTADKGFLEAPVIINGELQTGLGGGVCQVSTTTFNAAYEAGLPITARTNHALYISHYPLGRDATVNYPDTDLRFVNDTGHWLLLRTFVGSSYLEVDLYGTPTHRRVVSEPSALVVTGPPPTKTVSDPTLLKGKKVVEEVGEPSRATHVRRLVYDARGKLLYDNTWYSSYRGEPTLVRVGTKPKPKPPAKKKLKPAPAPPADVDNGLKTQP